MTSNWDRLRASYDHVAALYEERFADELDGKPSTAPGSTASPPRWAIP